MDELLSDCSAAEPLLVDASGPELQGGTAYEGRAGRPASERGSAEVREPLGSRDQRSERAAGGLSRLEDGGRALGPSGLEVRLEEGGGGGGREGGGGGASSGGGGAFCEVE